MVQGVDGRVWSVGRKMEWSTPATGDDFEHDVDGGRGAAFLILSSLFVFWLIVVVWAPEQVHVPWWLWLLASAVVLFFPIRWVLRRPWTIRAETPGDDQNDLPPARWIGMVRGRAKAIEEMRIVKRRIEMQGTPGHADSPLQPVN